MVLLAGVIAGALYNPWTGPQTREKLMDMIAGERRSPAAGDVRRTGASDAAQGGVGDARAPTRRRRPPVEPTGRGRRGGRQGEGLEGSRRLGLGVRVLERGSRAGERPLQRPRHEAARGRDVARVEQHCARAARRRPERRQARRARRRRATYVRPGGERDVLGAPPGDEERVRRDHAVVAVLEELRGVDLEVEVGERRPPRRPSRRRSRSRRLP